MAGKLTATQVKALGPGRHSDGANLFLHVKPTGWRGWKFITNTGGRRREKGLGPFPKVSLAEARRAANRVRVSIEEGGDPFATDAEAKNAVPTFREAAAQFIASMEPAWKNPKHRQQWRSTLSSYAAPIADTPVDQIDTNAVLVCLDPIWTTKPETASRVRGRVERVLDYARARGWRDGPNPALWRGNLSAVLPPVAKLRKGHHGAMPYREVPAFFKTLAGRDGIAASALAFAILTAARSGEVRGARWDEIDISKRLWVVPPARMKNGREHRVPLSELALLVLQANTMGDCAGLVFPGSKENAPLSDMSLTAVLRRMDVSAATVHGFRSSFSTWCAECTETPFEVREAALAHVSADRVASAYQRGDLFERRQSLMEDWARFCGGAL